MFSMAMKYEKFESDGKTSYTLKSRHENAIRIIDPLWGEPTGHQWLFLLRISNVEL